MDRSVQLVILAAATFLLSSCVSQARTSETVPSFKSLAFVTSNDLPELAQSESESEHLDKHVSSGATVGTAGGAAVGAVACGPVLYGACVAIMSWYGLVAGSVGGAALGLYSYSGLSDTDAAYVNQVLFGINEKRDFHSDLRRQVILRVPAETISAPQDADIQVVVWISQIRFTEVEKELIRTEMNGTMILAQALEPDEQPYTELYTAKASAKDIDDLIAGDGQLLESAIDECLSEIAERMSIKLKQLLAKSADKVAR